MGKGILVIGSLNMDLSMRVREFPLKGETILADSLSYSCGGKGANQACACAKLGGNVTMLGCLGCDDFGNKLCDNLKNIGVDISQIKRVEEIGTGVAIINVTDLGDNNIVVVPGANLKCDVSYLKENDELFQSCDFILLQMEIPHDAVEYAIRRGKELGKTVILNPAPAPIFFNQDVLSLVDYITPNETELQVLIKVKLMIKESMMRLKELGIPNVLVTLGEKGVAYINDDEMAIMPAFPADVVDTVSAGDCFNGALVVALAEDKNLEDALAFANAASSLAVTRIGAQESIPFRNEVDKVLGAGN